MLAVLKNEYNPDYVSPPGDTLSEILESRSMSQKELASRTGRTPKMINEIIKGIAPITSETAIQLERVLSIPASFWNNRQKSYDEFIAHQQETELLNQKLIWSKNFPYSNMVKLGWVPYTKDQLKKVKNLLNFFGVASPQAWDNHWGGLQVAYRKSKTHRPNDYALAAWLRCGEIIGNDLDCEPYDKDRFYSALSEVRSFTTLPANEFQSKVVSACASSGVAVVFTQELPKTASGATRWLSKDKALLQLSLKYKTDDHLWFTFFHEAGHILHHHKKGIYIENTAYDSEEESEANHFAQEFLIQSTEIETFIEGSSINKLSIRRFADRLGIAPGIVVGQLQKKGAIPWSHCNDLKRKLKWAEPT